MSDIRTIKRYSNRKLYDLQESRYVTLQEVAAFLQEGFEVQIVDNKTKEDITSITLAQILYEQEKNKKSSLPLGTLKGIIASSGELLQKKLADPVLAYKKEAERTVMSIREEAEKKVTTLKEQAERHMGKLMSSPREMGEEARAVVSEVTNSTQTALDDFTRSIDDRFKQLMRFTRQVEKQPSRVAKLLDKTEALEARVAELEKQLLQAKKPARKPRKTPAKKK
jgi:polyhydroxyalkanoate synthesis repressor PhaR